MQAGQTIRSPSAKYPERDGIDVLVATWKPHEKHGRLTTQSDLPDSVYAKAQAISRIYGADQKQETPKTDSKS